MLEIAMGSSSPPITDEHLQALVDGQLDQQTHESTISVVRKNPRLYKRLEELYYQKFLLKEWWQSVPLT